MSAKKPRALLSANDSKDKLQGREAAEDAMTPREPLTVQPPKRLDGHKIASEVWSRTVTLYHSVNGQVATAFDTDLLVMYSLLQEECVSFEDLRSKLFGTVLHLEKIVAKKPAPRSSTETMESWLNACAQYSALLARLQGLDARLDGKRKLIHSAEQSLYLTPRSRAGVTPPEKPVKDPITDPMEKILGE